LCLSVFAKTTALTPFEHVIKYSLIYLGMRKISDDKLLKITENPDNTKAV
jgi:hypothetical protein